MKLEEEQGQGASSLLLPSWATVGGYFPEFFSENPFHTAF